MAALWRAQRPAALARQRGGTGLRVAFVRRASCVRTAKKLRRRRRRRHQKRLDDDVAVTRWRAVPPGAASALGVTMASRDEGGGAPSRSFSERAASAAPSRAASRSRAGFGRALSSASGPPERRRKAPRPALTSVTPFRARRDSPSPPPSPPPSPDAQQAQPAQKPRVAAGELRGQAEALRAAAEALDRDAAAAERRQGASACGPAGDWVALACVAQARAPSNPVPSCAAQDKSRV